MVLKDERVSLPRTLLWALGLLAFTVIPLMISTGQDSMLIISAAQAFGTVGAVLVAVLVSEIQRNDSMATFQLTEMAQRFRDMQSEEAEMKANVTMVADIKRSVSFAGAPAMRALDNFRGYILDGTFQPSDVDRVRNHIAEAISTVDKICSFAFHSTSTASVCLLGRTILSSAQDLVSIYERAISSVGSDEAAAKIEEQIQWVLNS